METRITATELARSLSDVLNRVRYKEERFVIVATLAPAGPTTPTVGMTLRELVALLKDNPMPEGLADDLEEIQASQPPPPRPPW